MTQSSSAKAVSRRITLRRRMAARVIRRFFFRSRRAGSRIVSCVGRRRPLGCDRWGSRLFRGRFPAALPGYRVVLFRGCGPFRFAARPCGGRGRFPVGKETLLSLRPAGWAAFGSRGSPFRWLELFCRRVGNTTGSGSPYLPLAGRRFCEGVRRRSSRFWSYARRLEPFVRLRSRFRFCAIRRFLLSV